MTSKSPHAPSAKWTPTPWHVDHTINENMISQVGGSPILACLCRQSWDENDANAQRIVAAVNACSPIQGDPAEALALVREALTHLQCLYGNYCHIRAKYGSENGPTCCNCPPCIAHRSAIAALGSPL